MKSYELTYLISADLPGEEIKNISKKIENFAKDGGGAAEETSLIRRRLSYPIKKQTQAYLANLIFSLSEDKLGDLVKLLKSEKQVIRHLVAQKPKPSTKISVSKPVKKSEKPQKIEPAPKEKKVEIEQIEKKLAEILGDM